VPAFVAFLIFYGVCFVVTWVVYLRKPASVSATEPALAGV
jgi:NNP family nitrate/nitrite transporter-like MFS transporter